MTTTAGSNLGRLNEAAFYSGNPGVADQAISFDSGEDTSAPFSLASLFTFFLKVGAVLFGSGYFLLAFLRTDLVVRLKVANRLFARPRAGCHRRNRCDLSTSFILIAIVRPLVPRLRKSPVFGASLDGVNVGALALMVVVTWQLGRAALVDVTTIALALLSALALIRSKSTRLGSF
ncbi:MAG TPA: chromate transporter [Terriglobales bacterium]|nr:chromate transporter [Terriglobales bacterium]